MNNQTTIWILTVGFLLLVFIIRSIQKMRRETGDSKILEIENENALYDDYDDEEV